MKASASATFFLVVISLLVAMVLAIIPLSTALNYWRPLWVELLIVFWVLILPERLNVGVAWIVGLLLDVLHGSVLGSHALALTLVAYLVAKLQMRLRFITMLQQSLVILLLLFIYQAILFWIYGMIGEAPLTFGYWLPCIISALLWPLVFAIMRSCCIHYKINVSWLN